MNRLDITRYTWVDTLLRNPWPQFLLRAITLAGFLFTILAGLLGSVVGGLNFAIIFVWIAWWTALKLFFIPFGGRSWCSICPIPMPGEWLQRGGIFTPGQQLGQGKRWPRTLRGYWFQAGGFLLIGLFSAVTLTSARITAMVLWGIILLALVLSLIFERRSFCNFLCPIGGFTGLYAQAGPVELRIKDREVCRNHREKTCYEVCPWGQYPLALKSSANCGLCMECLRACPEDNITLGLRPWGSDLGSQTVHRLDEAFLSLVMLASVLVDAALFLGPWGGLKSAAYAIGGIPWLAFAGVFLLIALVILPLFYMLAVLLSMRFGKGAIKMSEMLAHQSQALVPLGLMAWIAFTVSFAFTKFSYILPVLSDPLGWGWNLIGMTGKAWVGQTTPLSQLLQIVILLGGLFWSSRVTRRISNSTKQSIPMIVFSTLFTAGMLWLLIG